MQAQTTQPGKRIFLAGESVHYSKAEETAKRAGGRLATLTEAVTDLWFFKHQMDANVTFVGWNGEAPGVYGYYHIDRRKAKIEPISEREAIGLHRDDKFYIRMSAIDAIRLGQLICVDARIEKAPAADLPTIVVTAPTAPNNDDIAQVACVSDEAPMPAQNQPLHFPVPRTDPKRWEALKRDLGISASLPDNLMPIRPLPDNLPFPTNERIFTAHGVVYRLLEYEKAGPTLKQTIEIAEQMGLQVLTIEEARAIVENKESNATFKNELETGKWGYVRDPDSEKDSRAACLYRDWGGGLDVYGGNVRPDDAAPVVILKER